jgi:short subunit dehydrogenase-like uncharacterized protein
MRILLYGANGYTGRLIAQEAAAAGLRLVLAGRSRQVRDLAGELGMESLLFSLDEVAATDRAVDGVDLLLNCAGPFIRTWRPLAHACIRSGAHYVDITGEIDVFEGLAALSDGAAAAGVVLLPGAGFDVVPTDCLALHLAHRLPSAARLMLAISGSGPLSHGTAATMIENQHRGGLVRRDGAIVSVPAAWRTREIDYGDGRPRTAVTIPWGDVATAWHTTGIPDIEVYAAAPRSAIRALRVTRHLRWLLRRPSIVRMQQRLLRMRAPGPSATELAHGTSRFWGRVEDDDGHAAESVMQGPNGYRMTVLTALLAVQRLLDGGVKPGFRTPAQAFGPDFILATERTSRRDVL